MRGMIALLNIGILLLSSSLPQTFASISDDGGIKSDVSSIPNTTSHITRRVSNARQSSVECGAVVGTLRIQEIKSRLLSDSGIPASAAGFATFLVQHDVQARKICASCQDFKGVCGPSAYGYKATVSGLLLIPVDDNGDVVQGPLAGHVNAHQALTETFQDIPSETFDQFGKHWLSIVAASSGKVAIEPDYLGYGESSNFFKSFLIRSAYATATIPLWQFAVETIAQESDCRSYLKPVAYLAGYGEGAFAALSIAEALHSTMNVEIVKASVGGGPYRMGSLALPRLIDNINERVMTSDHYFLLALLGSAYSSTNSGAANFGKNQDLLNPEYRDQMVRLVQEGGSMDSFLESMPARVTDIVNPTYFSWMKGMAVQGEYRGCLAGPPVEPDFNDHFCSALLENDLTDLVTDAEYDIDLCHSPDDEVFHIDNLPPEMNNAYLLLSSKLTRQLASGSHESAYRYCSQLAITEGLYTNPRLSPITECVPKPTLRPAGTPSVPTTPAPTPKPTTRVVEATFQTSSSSRFGSSSLLVLLVGVFTGVLFWQ